MHLRRRTTAAVAALGLATGLLAMSAPAASAHSRHHSHHLGDRSLAAVLTSDGNRFDHNPYDFDVVTEAVLAVLAAKPDSPVAVLADGSVPLTAFIPDDRAFRVLVNDLTGHWYWRESKVFATVASLGTDTVEQVLLYHVVPGATITSRQALRSDGATLATAQGGSITVDVVRRCWKLVRLVDQDPNDADPFLLRWDLDINKGNKQIAHGISRVLRPVDL